MRYQIKKVLGIKVIGRNNYKVRGYVVKDNETNWLFFMTRDPRFVMSRVVRGGFPYSINPREAWWDDVARYNLGPKDFNSSCSALQECGCSLIKKFAWTADSTTRVEYDGPVPEGTLDEMLAWTKETSGTESFVEIFRNLGPNTDYDCAETIDHALYGGTTASTGATTAGDEGARAGVPRGASTTVTEIKSDKYTADLDYVGFYGYHDHHGQTPNQPVTPSRKNWLVGVELEVECNNRDCKDRLNRIHSNWFYQERDGSLGDYGVELITIPLKPEDAKSERFWEPMTRVVNTLAKSWDKSSTGLHVHLSRTILGNSDAERSETLGKLLYFYHHLVLDNSAAERMNTNIYGRSHTYHEISGKCAVGDAAKVLGKECLKMREIKDRVKDNMIWQSNGDRYFDINIRNAHTIEFRKGKGSINPKRIVNIVAWSEMMCRYCKKTRWEDLSFDGFRSFVRDHSETPESLKALV